MIDSNILNSMEVNFIKYLGLDPSLFHINFYNIKLEKLWIKFEENQNIHFIFEDNQFHFIISNSFFFENQNYNINDFVNEQFKDFESIILKISKPSLLNLKQNVRIIEDSESYNFKKEKHQNSKYEELKIRKDKVFKFESVNEFKEHQNIIKDAYDLAILNKVLNEIYDIQIDYNDLVFIFETFKKEIRFTLLNANISSFSNFLNFENNKLTNESYNLININKKI